ncbi:MAG TPA: heavy metal translocating P-type ATPase, partial [Candidatus Krumholzibacterium sp.]|nr:heavy metal translocating P-type ATPase [Candidatus Krumholzibacterium sp.]
MGNHEHNENVNHGHRAEHKDHQAYTKHKEHQKHAGHGGNGAGDHGDHHAHMVADFRRRFWISLVLTVPVLVLSPMIQGFIGIGDAIRFAGDLYLLFTLSTAVFFYGGYPFLKGLIDELRSARPGMMTLIAIAITTAYVYSSAVIFGLAGKIFFWELVTLVDIMLLGHWIEMKSVMGASKALEELARLMPSDAHKIMPDGSIIDVPLAELKIGDRVLVRPGEKISADGKVVEGETSVDESMLTGESKPVSKSAGSDVTAGAVNAEGSITVEVGKTGKDSFLSQVIELVKEAQSTKSKTQDLANRAALWLTAIALASGTITLIVWFVVMSRDFAFALERTVTVMVITCPHALGLAVPLVVAVSTALSARNGLLIRNRAAFERARNIQAIIFDKTGTLTKGSFGVTDVLVLDDATDRDEILKLAASVEIRSEHPIAKGIARSSSDHYRVEDFKAIPGKGAEGIVNGKQIRIASPGY